MSSTAVDSVYTGPSPFLTTLIYSSKWDVSQTLTFFIEPVDWNQNGINDWVETGGITAIRAAYAAWTEVCNLTAQEVASIDLANFVEQVGFPFPGGSSYHALPGNFLGYGAYSIIDHGYSFGKGHNGLWLMLHEVGHGLGLLHPHGGVTFPGVTGEYDPGDFDLNSTLYSVMSYIGPDGIVGDGRNQTWGNVAGPMAFDIAAVQAMYGANMTVRIGDTVYDLPTANAEGTFWSCIWDAGGTDTLRYSGSGACSIDLRAASLVNEPGGGGWVSRASGIAGGFTIANGVVIENATGGSGIDQIVGNDVANTILGNGGNDVLRGEGGADTLTGGAGADTFLYHRASDSTAAARDTITDFASGIDRIDLTLLAPTGYSVSQAGGKTTLSVVTAQGTLEVVVNGLFTLDQLLPGRIAPLLGDGAANMLDGTVATDHIFGFDGADSIDGGDGADLLVGGASGDLLSGGAGNDTIYGGTGQDGLIDPDGGDLLLGDAGDDQLFGELGADHLLGSDGNDQLWGGAGNDLLDPGNGTEKVDGGSGHDLLVISDAGSLAAWTVNTSGTAGFAQRAGARIDFTSIEAMQLVLGNGADRVFTPFSGSNVVYTGGGNDEVYGGMLADILSGGDGNDLLEGGYGADWLDGGAGNDTFRVNDIADVVVEALNGGTDTVETSGSYYLYANVENLVLMAGSGPNFGVGNDLANTLTGNEFNNLLLGGAGNDVANGGLGDDSLYGQEGVDSLNGDAGVDYLAGGADKDSLQGGLDADALYGEDGDDSLTGGSGFFTDILVGGAGNDTHFANLGLGDYDILNGGAGNDVYHVDTPDDIIYEALDEGIDTVFASIGGAGYYLWANVENCVLQGTTPFAAGNDLDNALTGSDSANWLLGNGGNDRLEGNKGNDVLFGDAAGGAAGQDSFVFRPGDGQDVIGDFHHGEDKIELIGIVGTFAQLQARFVQNGANGAIDLGGGNLVVLNGVTMSTLSADDFILVPAAEPLTTVSKAFPATPFDVGLGFEGPSGWDGLHGMAMALF